MSGEEVFWVVVATCVAIVLRWATNRWPGPPDPPPRRRRRRTPPRDEQD